MIAKLIVRDVDRERARRRMLRALEEFEIGGVKTLLGFHRALLEHPCFVEGETCHGVVESDALAARAEELTVEHTSSRDGTGTPRRARHARRGRRPPLRGDRARVRAALARARAQPARARGRHGPRRLRAVVSPMQGTVLSVAVADGDVVEAGTVLCIVEAMKMENEIAAHRAGVVTELTVDAGPAGAERPSDLRAGRR